MTDSHAATLIARHAQLDERIAGESRRAASDDMLVATLKKQKLKLKEMLSRIG